MAVITNQVSTSGLAITISNPPETATSAGSPGTLAWDENFIYVCVAQDTWARTNISTAW